MRRPCRASAREALCCCSRSCCGNSSDPGHTEAQGVGPNLQLKVGQDKKVVRTVVRNAGIRLGPMRYEGMVC